MVKASNNDGVWNPEITTLEVIIHPPFWATWWFRAIAFILILTGIRTFYQFRRRMAIQQLKGTTKRRTSSGTIAVFYQYFTRITNATFFNIDPLEKLKKDFPSPLALPYYDMIQRNAKRLLALTNELMDFRKVESGALQLHVMQGNINIFLTEIAEEFQDLAIEKGIEFKILPTLLNKLNGLIDRY
jgi:signal transduction histidine kinase